MDEKQKQEMKEKAKAVAIETAQKAKEAGKAAAAKADELYNKLPLDKINEKLGGKVDVKSPVFKKVFFSIIVGLLLIFVYSLFSGSGSSGGVAPDGKYLKKAKILAKTIEKKNKELTVLGNKIEEMTKKFKEKEPAILAQVKKEMEEEPIPERFDKANAYQNGRLLLKLLQTNRKLYKQYRTAENVATRGGDWVRNAGLTPQEYVDFVRKKSPSFFEYEKDRTPIYWENEESQLKSNIQTNSEYYFNKRRDAKLAELYKDVTPLQQKYADLKAEISKMTGEKYLAEQQATWKAVRKLLEKEVPRIINEKLDESFDTCRKVVVDKKPYHYEYSDRYANEWRKGVATLYNSRTGKQKQRKVDITYGIDKTNGKVIICTELSNYRP